jgi:predicted dehydrogenase
MYRGQDVVEINGSGGTIVYSTQRPLELQIGRRGDRDVKTVPVPKEFLVYPGSPRNPSEGDPLVTFRYDQTVEFIQAISEGRSASPSFLDGARAQAVMDAAVLSAAEKRWVDVPEVS